MNQIVDATKMVKPISECTTVAELLADPARWTKKTSARNKEGNPVHPVSKDACRWCIWGAINYIYNHRRYADVKKAEQEATLAVGENYALWNDAPERTHAEVMDVVRRAGI